MSFDLLVFELSAAPRQRQEFLDWYQRQAEWAEGHSYDDPAITSAPLQSWFHEMRQRFPAMNGPYRSDADDPHITDYCIGTNVIYAGFRWSVAEEAYGLVRELATRHGVGFFDVSSGDENEPIHYENSETK